jgi:hypothetical protein
MVGVYACLMCVSFLAVHIAVKFWHVMFLPGQISWFCDTRETFLSLIIALGKERHSCLQQQQNTEDIGQSRSDLEDNPWQQY